VKRIWYYILNFKTIFDYPYGNGSNDRDYSNETYHVITLLLAVRGRESGNGE